MNVHEVPEPILNSPFEEPKEHWRITEHEPPQRISGRRPAMYFYRPPGHESSAEQQGVGTAIGLKLVNRIRTQLAEWRPLALRGEGGVTRTTMELLRYWRREGRKHGLFFAQLEAAETVIFLTEARPDFLQGIEIPLDEPGSETQASGLRAFRRYACKMATGTGKTTVMGMLAAWSILNKIAARGDRRYSDTVLVVCPNVTIRNRLEELKPQGGEASLYRTRDLVPPHLMSSLAQGSVLVMNWHVFEPKSAQADGQSGRVIRAGQEIRTRETIRIGAKSTTMRGSRYLTLDDLKRQVDLGLITVLGEQREPQGNLKSVTVESARYVESDSKLVDRVLAREVGGKGNILLMNDEAHHAYRIRHAEPDDGEEDLFGESNQSEEFFREATVWIEGLDRIHKLRGINLCVDLSATPYYLGRVGQDANRPFPWVVSDFGLVDAIESGLVKIPQLAVRDTSGSSIPGYFNIWRWILPQLTAAERGGRRGSVKPEAILKHAHVPIAMLGGLWELLRDEWGRRDESNRPPVFIIVCKNTALAKVIHRWLGHDDAPVGIPPARLDGLRNTDGDNYTIRVDSKVVQESDGGEARSDADRWMRLTLDTIGKTVWPQDTQGRPLYPEGFEALADKSGKPLHPPGRDVRCIVSVGMLTEGWDCNTVTHIIGLRPFMSQLLCEQVVGRGLRRLSYAVEEDGRLGEDVAKIFGVPFEVIPLKTNPPAYRSRRRRLDASTPCRSALISRSVSRGSRDTRLESAVESAWTAHALFPQLATVVQRYLDQKVRPIALAKEVDAFLSPWYGWLLERLLEAIHPEAEDADQAESPRYETNRGPGSTEEVDFETRREPYPVTKSHVNAVMRDTAKWEQSAAHQIDRNKHVKSFVKNAGLGFAIPYLHNGEHHEYIPDFIIQLTGPEPRYLILETKGYDPFREVKEQAAQRWVRAVNGTDSFGQWAYTMVTDVSLVREAVLRAATTGSKR